MKKKILIIGYGYTAQHLSALLNEHNILVSATTRNPDKIQKFSTAAIKLIYLNPKQASINITDYDSILVSAPPNTDGTDPAIELIKHQLVKRKNQIKWVGYLSSTSVYGNHEGEWVNEESKPNIPGERGKRRLQAERSWMALFDEFNLPIHIFRLAGIYGPERNSLVKILRGKTTSIIKKGQVFSRIHVEDICKALYESIKHPTPGEIYNLADDLPCAPDLVDEYAAQLLEIKPLIKIPYEKAVLPPLAKEFYQDCRKVKNTKAKNKLILRLSYPSYKEGLLTLYQHLKNDT
ncbi:MAG: SDR family oxidoreductase [Coxiellaceae bacterium]|nr:SDR family oxidoreductase [Coxiellaceae bacterium]